MEQKQSESLLASFRVLDLTDEKGFLCGRVFGDFGADVIKIEPPGGDPGRATGPFYHDIPDPQKSLYWLAYNANKRGITLNIEATEGQAIFKKLVTSADLVIESFRPGHMAGLGLAYQDLRQVNPGIIMTSITSFGQSGPWKDCKGSDIALWALSSYMYVTGDEDRPPVCPSFPQAFLHAGLEGATASLVALHHRQLTGEGQWVDVSAQDALAIVNLQNQQYWNLARFNPQRAGACQLRAGVRWGRQQRLWKCRDGFVIFIVFSGHMGAQGNKALTGWMASEGLAPEFMKRIDWATFDPQGQELTDEQYRGMMVAISGFFERHTKAELYEGAVQKRIVLYPCNTTEDLMHDAQLQARGFWTEIPHAELGGMLTYPRPCMSFSEEKCDIRRRAPLIGEHNEEVYVGELGFSKEDLARLREKGVI
jgi:crotonobetainyl-CoA:carnitine CoA-transferase CaiB-like acyl-CoA transferase